MTEHRFTPDHQKDERELRIGIARFLADNGITLSAPMSIATADWPTQIGFAADRAGKIVETFTDLFDSALVIRIGVAKATAGAPAGHAGTEPTPPPAVETCPHAQPTPLTDGRARCKHCGAIGWMDPFTRRFYLESPDTSTRPAMTPEVAEMAQQPEYRTGGIVPKEIEDAARKVEKWFVLSGRPTFEFCGICSRDHADKLRLINASLIP